MLSQKSKPLLYTFSTYQSVCGLSGKKMSSLTRWCFLFGIQLGKLYAFDFNHICKCKLLTVLYMLLKTVVCVLIFQSYIEIVDRREKLRKGNREADCWYHMDCDVMHGG